MSPCSERSKLVLQYSDSTKRYSDAVTELNSAVGKVTRTEYERLYRIAEETRVASEYARLTMELHVSQHGC